VFNIKTLPENLFFSLNDVLFQNLKWSVSPENVGFFGCKISQHIIGKSLLLCGIDDELYAI
jgi:hypothetical protein